MRIKMALLIIFLMESEMAGLRAEDAVNPPPKTAPAPAQKKKSPPKPLPGMLMDYGPFLSYSIQAPKTSKKDQAQFKSVETVKGITIKLGKVGEIEAAVCFDSDVLRLSAGWTGGLLELSNTNIGSLKGSEAATIKGALYFSNRNGPGWTNSGSFNDPRPGALGPLPPAIARYTGLYVHGNKVILAYRVGDCEILEMPGFAAKDGAFSFTRTFRVSKTSDLLTLAVCDAQRPGAEAGEPAHAPRVTGQPGGSSLIQEDGRFLLKLPALKEAVQFTVAIGAAGAQEGAAESLQLETLCKGGFARWQPIETQGVLGKESGPYAIDTLSLPEKNPWNAWMRPAGLDFFSDGRAAIATLNGDVWIVNGIDDTLAKLTWQRFATGLFEPLGLKIVDNKVYVLGRDQITRLHDLNNDGEADYYENFNNSGVTHPSYHAFAFDLHTDRAGNFYYAKGGNQVEPGFPLHSALFRVSKDGAKMDVVATGLRAPNGLGMGPNDEITCGDNQGHWIPSSKISLVKSGGFYGHVIDPRKGKKEPPASFDQPICWLPMSADSSSGSQVWASGDKWGPFSGSMLHTSYGKCALFLVMTEPVEGGMQGGVVKFPLNFKSGIMRGRFNGGDGQLYLCGLKGWQTSGARDGALHRVRYTGKPVHMPCKLAVVHNGISLTFTCPLDSASASDEENFSVEQWNYKWIAEYVSPDYSVAEPDKKGRDPVAIKSLKLSDDRKTVTLEIPGIKPVMQMQIQCKLQAADGSPIQCEIFNTIHNVPKAGN